VTGLTGIAAGPYALAAMPARYALERGDWRAAAKLVPSPSRYPFTEAMTHFARALGAARSGDPAAAEGDIGQNRGAARHTEGGEERLLGERGRGDAPVVARLGGARAAESDEALDLMRQAADTEDKSEKNIVTPGASCRPASCSATCWWS